MSDDHTAQEEPGERHPALTARSATDQPDTGLSGILDDRFEPVQHLATGRKSTLVRARERSCGRDVALKILHPHLASQESVLARIRRELAAVRRLDHPAVVRIHDLVEEEQTVALVMEFVAGESVRERVDREGAMDWSEAKRVLESILAALEQAHERGIWHRDLSAEHVMIDGDGKGRVVGFGMARVDELVALTMHTQVLGSLEAMAPERVLGMEYDGRADLYSVGAVAYEMLVGHPPTEGTMGAAFSQARRGGEESIEEFPEELPKEVRYLLERSLVSDPSTRFATASQMRQALDGDYDEELWKKWASRRSDRCAACDAPLIDGITGCVECGHQHRRLIQAPGEGSLDLMIISPKDAFEPDVWFERNTEPSYLPPEVVEALMELLGSYEDTRRAFDYGPEYRWPPYMLARDLTYDDAKRICELLHERSIPYRTRPSHIRIDFSRADGTREQSCPRGHTPEPGNGPVLLVYVILAFSRLKRGDVALVTTAAVVVGAIWGTGWYVGLPGISMAVSTVAFFTSVLLTRFVVPGAAKRLTGRSEMQRVMGTPVMIPTEELMASDRIDADVQLPSRTASVIKGCEHDFVRSELRELLVLAAAVATEGDVADREAFLKLVDEILSSGERLDEALVEVREHTTAELYAELERVEESIDAGEGDSDELHRRRTQALEAIAEHDRAVHEMTHLRSTLQMARGALLDLLSEIGEARQRFVLSFDEEVETSLTELKVRLEAMTEVETIASAEEIS